MLTHDLKCSHEIKRHLLLGRKVMANVDSIFKSRDRTLPRSIESRHKRKQSRQEALNQRRYADMIECNV